MTTESGARTAVAPEPGAKPGVRAKRTSLRRYLSWLKLLPILIIVALVARQRLVAPVSVQRHVVDQGDVVREVFGRATIESRREVELGFDLVGRVSDVLVDEGDRVKLGQVVAHLAPEQLTADVHAASSGIVLARAAPMRLAADERRAQASLAFAQQEAVRMRALASSGAVSTRDLDLAEQQLALARADVDRVHATQTEAQKQIAVATSATASKTATVTRTALVSPFDGVVIRRFKDPGDTVVAGSTVLRVSGGEQQRMTTQPKSRGYFFPRGAQPGFSNRAPARAPQAGARGQGSQTTRSRPPRPYSSCAALRANRLLQAAIHPYSRFPGTKVA